MGYPAWGRQTRVGPIRRPESPDRGDDARPRAREREGVKDAHLCAFRFDPGVAFEGGVVAAIERMQLTGAVQVLDGLCVARDPANGALAAVDLDASGASKSLAGLLDFRLD